jgi:hypothetical protein
MGKFSKIIEQRGMINKKERQTDRQKENNSKLQVEWKDSLLVKFLLTEEGQSLFSSSLLTTRWSPLTL